MSCLVIVEFLCKEGRSPEFIDMCRRNYPVTRSYDGCNYVFLSVDKENENSLIMVEAVSYTHLTLPTIYSV